MIAPEEFCEGEWAEWYQLTPLERWRESGKLWAEYLKMGGSLDPEPDTQSPFYDGSAPGPRPVDGRPGLRVLRRSPGLPRHRPFPSPSRGQPGAVARALSSC